MAILKSLIMLFAVCFGLQACQQQGAELPKEEPPEKTTVISEDEVPHAQLGDNVIPSKYRIHMKIDPRADSFTGTVQIDVDIKQSTTKIWLHGKEMTVSDVVARSDNGNETIGEYVQIDPAEAPSGIASLNFETPVGPGAVTLVIPYETPFNTALNSAYKVVRKTDTHTDNYIVTQFEAIGAREAFPSFDEPRFKVPFDISISSPSEDVVYANKPIGTRIEREDGWTKHVFDTTRPLPTYLIAFGVGPWDVVDYAPLPPTDVRKREIPLRGIAARGEGKNFEYALKNTAGILEALEAYFGIPYPYEKLDLIAAPEYAFGAMENPGAIVYTEFLMLMNEGSSLGQRRAYARVHGHELAHQWFGDLVTPVWWEDIWLNEAFATWMGNKGVDIWQPDGNYDRVTLNAALGAMGLDSLASTRKIREPLLRSENVMDQFDSITYRKGGGVLSMFESYLGEERFQKGVRLHMERFEDDVATADDFFQSMADGSGDKSVVAAMKSFVDQPGLPLVNATLNCEADVHKLDLKQSRYARLGSTITQGQSWQIPVCIRYEADGEAIKSCALLDTPEQSMSLESQSCPKWLTVNADGAGYYRYSLDTAAWSGLLNNLASLNTREALTALDSLKAAYDAGEVESGVYLDGLKAFAAHPEYDVSRAAGSKIWSMKAYYLPDSAKDDLARFTREMYADRYAAIKNESSAEADLLGPTLANRLVNVGNDTALGSEMADAGISYLGLDGEPDTSALPPKLLALGLEQAFLERGEAALPAMLSLIKSGTPAEKGNALAALTSTTSQEIAALLRADTLSNKDVFTNRQASRVVTGLLGNMTTRDETWTWFKANFDEFVENRVLDVRKGGVPGYGRNFCSNEKAVEVEAFFTEKVALIPGYERSLAQTLESINLCAALKTAKSEELAQALAAR